METIAQFTKLLFEQYYRLLKFVLTLLMGLMIQVK